MSSLKSAAANIILLMVSCVIAVAIFEFAQRHIGKKEQLSPHTRYMLLSDGKNGQIFRNIDKFFVYEPNQRIRSVTYYYVDNNWTKEYDYIIPTNNLGLVQSNVTENHVPSVVLLGDSFTEGQGASPWFESFRSNFSQKTMQYVNGGLIGTGFQQWQLLHDYLLSEGVEIKYLVVIFISDDYRRYVWNFRQRTFNCLANYKVCVGNEDFYGMPLEGSPIAFLEKLRHYRDQKFTRQQTSFMKQIQQYFPSTTRIFNYSKESVAPTGLEGNRDVEANREVIRKFISQYKDNIYFVHIPVQGEVMADKITFMGITANEDIEKFGGNVYDGLSHCSFTATDYLVNDGHPNASGYAKIAACVRAAVKEKWGLQ
jgi:hypothetical protein